MLKPKKYLFNIFIIIFVTNTSVKNHILVKNYFTLLFALSFLTSFGQEINIGKRDTIFSKILNQERAFSVYLPPSYHANENQNFPVLYILDGDYNYRYVSGLLELEGAISERIPEMILVAISGKDTETYRYNSKPNIKGIEDKGNASEVAEFMAQELIPYVNANYKTNEFKILSGHSIGGLFVINTALHHPQLFDRYIAISPALWWEGNAINQVAESQIDDHFETQVYISLGKARNMGVDSFLASATSSILKKPIFIFGLAILCILIALFWGIKRKKIRGPLLVVILGCGAAAYLYFYYYPENDAFKFQRFAGENHNSVGEPTYRWALEDIFETWRKEAQYFASTEEFKKHYNQVNELYGTTFNIPYTVLGNTHYMLKNEPDELAAFEKELKINYPRAYATYAIYKANQLLEKHPQKSRNLALEILTVHPNSFKSVAVLAKIDLSENKMKSADSLINKAIEKAGLQNVRQWQMNELIGIKKNIDR